MFLDTNIIHLMVHIELGHYAYDKCYICGWTGLSEDVKDNRCPVCDSEDMDDIDGNQYE